MWSSSGFLGRVADVFGLLGGTYCLLFQGGNLVDVRRKKGMCDYMGNLEEIWPKSDGRVRRAGLVTYHWE